MTTYATVCENRKRLLDSIKNELDAYNKNMKELEAELIEIGNANKDQFDADNNLYLERGYLHIGKQTVVTTSRKFDVSQVLEENPDLVDFKLRVKPVKELFLDKEGRKQLKEFGIKVSTEDVMEVKTN
jgi:hypothetical protein